MTSSLNYVFFEHALGSEIRLQYYPLGDLLFLWGCGDALARRDVVVIAHRLGNSIDCPHCQATGFRCKDTFLGFGRKLGARLGEVGDIQHGNQYCASHAGHSRRDGV